MNRCLRTGSDRESDGDVGLRGRREAMSERAPRGGSRRHLDNPRSLGTDAFTALALETAGA